jgi:RhtB (resistance to homoserine/threonine) family protein
VDSQLIAFALAAGALTLAPGPDTMLVIRNVLRGGRRDGVVTTFGICAGLFVHATLSALGVSILLVRSATAFNLMKLVGAGYLVWLGVQSLRRVVSLPALPDNLAANRETHRRSWKQCFVEGWLSNVLNPKTAVFYLAFLPQFISPTDPVFEKSLLLAGIHFVEGIIWLGALSMLLDYIRQFLLKSAVRRGLEGVCGGLLVGFGARLALAKR